MNDDDLEQLARPVLADFWEIDVRRVEIVRMVNINIISSYRLRMIRTLMDK